jgi:hypothetical protein
MGPKTLSALVTLLLALPATGAQRQRSFRVGAVVVRSAAVHVGAARLRLAGTTAVAVQIDSARPQLAAGAEVPLPPGTTVVTVQY